ncbi:MAG: ParB N-terminal domain-containing protein [Anaerolineae bacterium]
MKPFREAVGESSLAEAYYLGVQSVVTDEIVGSLGRAREFSRAFLPVGSKTMQRERWRQSYTWLLCGQVRPPIRVCGAGGGYYVVNGHHRVSAARYLGVRTMLAHVSDIDTTKVTGVGGEDRSGQPECVAVCEI